MSSSTLTESPPIYGSMLTPLNDMQKPKSKSGYIRIRPTSLKVSEYSQNQRPITVGSNRDHIKLVEQDTPETIKKKGTTLNPVGHNSKCKSGRKTSSRCKLQSQTSNKVYSGKSEDRLPFIGVTDADRTTMASRYRSQTRERHFYDHTKSSANFDKSFDIDEESLDSEKSVHSRIEVESKGLDSAVSSLFDGIRYSHIPETESSVISDISDDESEQPNLLTISDSDECDTDLEIDKNFGKEVVPDNDVFIGRTLYERECSKWQTAPQKYIIRSLGERVISLRNKSLGLAAISPLCTALRDNLRVERLNLGGVDVGEDGIQHVAEMLLENINISHINLANNNLGVRGAQVIGHVMILTKCLTHLNLSGNKLNDQAAWYFSSSIGTSISITHLDLSYNEFSEQGGILIGTGLARNEKLLNLNMRWNKIRGKGAVAIFQSLMVNSTLEVLDISWNGLGYEGAVVLSKCLKANTGLRDLDVSNNRLDWRCSPLIAEGLRQSSTISRLKVGYNPLTTTGCMSILEAATTETSTVSLLDCSEVPVVGEADLLAATISRRRKFQFIHGGIISTNDKVGERAGREVNPMVRIIEYLKLLGLRPLELMKSFDKSSSFEIPRAEFVEQIKKIGVNLHTFEIEALANSVSGKGYNQNVINYRKLSKAVREVVNAERERKMKEQKEWMLMKSYHDNILKKGQLDVMSKTASPRMTGYMTDIDNLKVNSVHMSLMGASHTSLSSKASPGNSRVQLSMCEPLGSNNSDRASQPIKRSRRRKHVKKM